MQGYINNAAEYRSWAAMKQRCYNSKLKNYKDYGGRGIRVCAQWVVSFEHFLADMGPRPSPHHSLDREDVDGWYTPDNCRWATAKEQANNKRPPKVFQPSPRYRSPRHPWRSRA